MWLFNKIVKPECAILADDCSNKKRLLELSSKLLSQSYPGLDSKQVLNQLMARERLGSTGIGYGIAIPHARVSSVKEPVATLAYLKNPIDFNAEDSQAVDLVYTLIVPESATDEHLQILSSAAEAFSSKAYRDQLRQSTDDKSLFRNLQIQ